MIKQVLVFGISLILGLTFASRGNRIISTEVRGSGQPAILIHGMACSAQVWDDVASYYSNRYELHLVTIAGFGNNNTIESQHILRAVRDELIDYVVSRSLNKPILIGHSMGGFLSLWAAVTRPELFGKIVSVDGVPYFPTLVMPGITPETAAPLLEMMQQNMTGQDYETARATQEMMIASMIGNEAKRPMVVDMAMKSNGAVIAKAMGEMYTTDIRSLMAYLESPVLVLGSWYGYRDFGTTMESAKAGFKAQFENNSDLVKVKMAETALHFIFYDEPEWFFKAVDTFLGDADIK